MGVFGFAPFGCTPISNSVAFGFEYPGVITNDYASEIVSIVGLVRSIPSSNQPKECMCWSGDLCGSGFPLTMPCTLGGAGTPTYMDNCPGGGPTMDTQLRFEQAYGCRP